MSSETKRPPSLAHTANHPLTLKSPLSFPVTSLPRPSDQTITTTRINENKTRTSTTRTNENKIENKTEMGTRTEKKEETPTRMRFIVSGQTFDVLISDLNMYPNSILAANMRFAMAAKVMDKVKKVEEDKPAIPYAVFSRDAQAFRILVHFLTNKELIVPSHPTEWSILRTEAKFYGLDDVVQALDSSPLVSSSNSSSFDTTRTRPSVEAMAKYSSIPFVSNPTTTATTTKFSSGSRLERFIDGFIRSKAAFVRTPNGLEEEEEKELKTLSKTDQAYRDAEIPARRLFAQDKDGTKDVGLVEILKTNWNRVQETDPLYTFLIYPHDGPRGYLTASSRFITNYNVFRQQFRALTLGLLDGILENLPIVAAGGAVLAALHAWPAVSVPSTALWHFPDLNSGSESRILSAFVHAFVQSENVVAPNNDDMEDVKENEKKMDLKLAGILSNMYRVKWEAARGLLQVHRGHVYLPCDAKEETNEKQEQERMAHRRALDSFLHTDVDLFLVTRDPDKALEAIVKLDQRIRFVLGDHAAHKMHVIRSENSITFIPPPPYRRIQVITRLYYSMEQVLLGFDLDSCCVGYDGKRVLALPRAVRALALGYNLVDPTRQSTTYETRLLKYARRGFRIATPGLDVDTALRVVIKKITSTPDTETLDFQGCHLLLAKLHLLAVNPIGGPSSRRYNYYNNMLRKRLCAPLCDYGPTRSTLFQTNMLTVIGKQLQHVLFSNVSNRGQRGEYVTDLPSTIEFRIKTPHAQDRVDVLFTGSFCPTFVSWYTPDVPSPIVATVISAVPT